MRTRAGIGLILSLLICTGSVWAQKVEMAPLPLKPSTFLDDLRALRLSQPKLALADVVTEANRLIDKQGMNYSFFLDAATCTRVSEAQAKQKDPSVPVRLAGSLQSVDGDRARIALPEARFSPAGCGGCYLNMPLLQITGSSFITVLMGRNIGFSLPSNFTPVRAVLLDEKDARTVKRVWSIPERMEPIGVTHDENVLYLAFRQPELADLSLAVFTEGTFQVATRTEAEEGGKGEKLKSGSAASLQAVKFFRWRRNYVVGYDPPCE